MLCLFYQHNSLQELCHGFMRPVFNFFIFHPLTLALCARGFSIKKKLLHWYMRWVWKFTWTKHILDQMCFLSKSSPGSKQRTLKNSFWAPFNDASVSLPVLQACRISTTCTPTALRSLWSWAAISFLLHRPYPESGWATGRHWSHTLSRSESTEVTQHSSPLSRWTFHTQTNKHMHARTCHALASWFGFCVI